MKHKINLVWPLVTAQKSLVVSICRFVLQTPRFWESLIGVDNYKGYPLDDVPLLWVRLTSVHAIKEHR